MLVTSSPHHSAWSLHTLAIVFLYLECYIFFSLLIVEPVVPYLFEKNEEYIETIDPLLQSTIEGIIILFNRCVAAEGEYKQASRVSTSRSF
jgi:hypothetical protein